MTYATDGALPQDTRGVSAEGVYTPGVGTVAAQGGTVTTDSTNQPYAPTVVAGASGSPFVAKAANISPTLADVSMVTALSPANTGLPVNVPTIVQKAVAKSTGSVASLAPAFTTANVAGNTIVVVCGIGNGTDPTIADTNTNTYVKAVTGANSTTFEASIWYASGIAAGANTVTVTNAGTAASMVVEIYEVSGLLTQSGGQPGQTITNTGTGTSATTSNISSGTPNTIAFAGVAVGTAAQTITAGSGWTNDSGQQNPTTPAGLYSFASLSQSVPSVGNVAVSATVGSSEPWAMAVATFRPVALPVEGTVRIAGYNKTNITSATTTLVKGGKGVLHSVTINKLVASATIELDDALTNTNSFGIITLPGTITALAPFTVTYDAEFGTALSVTTSGATDITLSWK